MNFALILFLATVITGVMWAWDRYSLKAKRKAVADMHAREFEAANREAIDRGEKAVIDTRNAMYAK
ncbi:MAG: signal peptidase I, partial [Sutterellaceae bacterium]|nr:signal peptidase I [Sutterellaceae bacterium]